MNSSSQSVAGLGASAPNDQRVVDVTNVSRSYGSLRAVESITFQVRRGESVVLMAPSGAGKSTLLRVVLGVEEPSSGECVHYVSADRIGVSFQEDSLLPWLTVEENVRLLNHLTNRPVSREQLDGYLGKLGLQEFRAKFPRQLSTGMKQKTALCRLLVFAPDVYVIDESMANIDDFMRFTLCDMLREKVIGQNASIIAVTHNPTDALHLADRILIGSGRPLALVGEVIPELPRNRIYTERFTRRFSDALEELRKCSG